MSTDLSSPSALCQSFGCTFAELSKAIERAGVQPSLVLDGRVYFDSAAVKRIRPHAARIIGANKPATKTFSGPKR